MRGARAFQGFDQKGNVFMRMEAMNALNQSGVLVDKQTCIWLFWGCSFGVSANIYPYFMWAAWPQACEHTAMTYDAHPARSSRWAQSRP